MFDDLEFDAEEELKRADHMIYVTLKYTRTADVIQNIIKRLTNAYEFTMLEALNKVNKEPIKLLSKDNLDLLKEKIPEMKKYAKDYQKLKELGKAKYKGESEYRKGVALVTDSDRVDMERIKEYFANTKECVMFLKNYFK